MIQQTFVVSGGWKIFAFMIDELLLRQKRALNVVDWFRAEIWNLFILLQNHQSRFLFEKTPKDHLTCLIQSSFYILSFYALGYRYETVIFYLRKELRLVLSGRQTKMKENSRFLNSQNLTPIFLMSSLHVILLEVSIKNPSTSKLLIALTKTINHQNVVAWFWKNGMSTWMPRNTKKLLSKLL